MGQSCPCKCPLDAFALENTNEIITHHEEAAIKENDLVKEEPIKPLNAGYVKSEQDDLFARVKTQLKALGKPISQDEFNRKVRNDFAHYSASHPLKEEQFSKKNLFKEDPIEINENEIYWGTWNEDCKMEGPGKMIKDNMYLEGFWMNGSLEKGRVFDGEVMYEGEFKNYLPNGQGKMIFQNLDFYEGDFVDGQMTGNGLYQFIDGTKYWGEFKDGEIEGNGEFIWTNGYSYKGDFRAGVPDGKGILTCPNGSSYNGELSIGRFNGEGRFTWILDEGKKNIVKYIGGYVEGKKEGTGKYILQNGDFYEGEWKDGKPHGNGTYETENAYYKGEWRYGENNDFTKTLKEGGIETKDPNLNFEVLEEDIDFTCFKHLNIEVIKASAITNCNSGVQKGSLVNSLRSSFF